MSNLDLLGEELIIKNNQEQLLICFEKMDEKQKKEFIEDIKSIDFEKMKYLYEKKIEELKNNKIYPIEYIDKSKLTIEKKKYYDSIGIEEIKKGKYAVVTMAGGQRNKTWT